MKRVSASSLIKRSAFIFFWLQFFFSCQQFNAQSNTDSLKNSLSVQKSDTGRLKILRLLVNEITNPSDWAPYNDEIGKISNRLITNSNQRISWLATAGLSDYYNNLGFLDELNSDEKKAVENFSLSLKYKRIVGDEGGIAEVMNNLGGIYIGQGNYAVGLECLYSALRSFEKLNHAEGIMVTLDAIGSAFIDQKDYEKALDSFRSALKFAEREGVEEPLAGTYDNLAGLFEKMKNYDSALIYHKKSLAILRPMDYTHALASAYNNIAEIYLTRKDFSPALAYLDTSEQYARKINFKSTLSAIHGNRSKIYHHLGDLKKSLSEISIAEKYAREAQSPELIYNVAYLAYKLNKESGDFKKAMEFQDLYVRMRDSVENEKNKKEVLKRQFQYEYETKAAADSIRQIEEKKFEKFSHEQELNRQRAFTWGGIIAFACMFVIALVSYRAYRQKQRANQIISQQKLEVEKQKAVIEDHQNEILDSIRYAKRLQESLLPSEKFIDRILRGFKNP